MTLIKTLKHKYYLSLGTCHKYVVQFTVPTPTIFLNAKRAKLTFFRFASTIYHPIKTMFVLQAVSQAQCIIYRPDLLNSRFSRKILKK